MNDDDDDVFDAAAASLSHPRSPFSVFASVHLEAFVCLSYFFYTFAAFGSRLGSLASRSITHQSSSSDDDADLFGVKIFVQMKMFPLNKALHNERS